LNIFYRYTLLCALVIPSFAISQVQADEEPLAPLKEKNRDVVSSSQNKEPEYHKTVAGDWFTRLRALYVYPDDSSGSLSTVPHSGVSVWPAWTGEFDFGYMFTKNLGSELILGITRHTLMGKKALAGTKVGHTWLLPPTLTLQWRFLPSSIVQPYAGAGVNYTLFFWNDSSIANTDLSLKHSWGPALQGGIDFFVFKDWLLNVDVKYIWIDTKARLTGAVPGTVHVNVNPWVIGVGFGRKW